MELGGSEVLTIAERRSDGSRSVGVETHPTDRHPLVSLITDFYRVLAGHDDAAIELPDIGHGVRAASFTDAALVSQESAGWADLLASP